MIATGLERTAKADWQRVEACISFGGSIYWPFALLLFLPNDSGVWTYGIAALAVVAVISVLRKRHGLKMLWDESDAK